MEQAEDDKEAEPATQPEAIDGFSDLVIIFPEDRAKRIAALMNPKSDWDMVSVGKMIF
jgi:penicillin amidase